MMRSIHTSLENRAVIVSGGATGIGAAIVEEFAAQGARVGFLDIDAASAEALISRLAPEARHEPVWKEVDLSDGAAVVPAVTELVGKLGGAHVLVNNAARDDRHKLSDVTPEYWRDRLAVNLDHHVLASKAVLPAMERAGGGVIINMGSCSWRLGLGGMIAYVTAKAAIEGLTNGLARELGPSRIRVNCVVPGFVRTERQVEKWLTPALEEVILAGQCLPDLIEPADVAALVAFLASDAARSCTSGAYTVDAGWI
jgi:NAD(P)-dependent dehydrogenase (short-subunit alcohol dehydrogenase family)